MQTKETVLVYALAGLWCIHILFTVFLFAVVVGVGFWIAGRALVIHIKWLFNGASSIH